MLLTRKYCALSTVFAATLAAAIMGDAAAATRFNRSARQSEPDTAAERPARAAPVRNGALGVVMMQLMRDCEQQAEEFKNFPADEIVQVISLDNMQADALKNARNASIETGNVLAQSCPPAIPPDPADRLDMVEREIDGVEQAVSRVQPAFETLYGVLNDDQKAHLVLRFGGSDARGNATPESTGSGGRGTDDPKRRGTGDPTGSRLVRARWSCEQWQATLRAWPGDRTEQAIAINPRQRAAFFELAAAMQRAADTLADSCPQDTSVMPVARIAELRKKLAAMRQSITAIRPALNRFYEIIDGGQRNRLNDAI
jgi:LTXXQ motif family protein